MLVEKKSCYETLTPFKYHSCQIVISLQNIRLPVLIFIWIDHPSQTLRKPKQLVGGMGEVVSIPATAGLNHNDHKFFHLQASQVWLQLNTPQPQIPGRLLPDWKAARQLLSSHRHSARLLSVYSHLTNSPLNSRSNSRTMAKSTTGFWMRKMCPWTKLNFFQMITELPFSTRQRTLKQLFSRKNVQLWFCQVPQCQNEGSQKYWQILENQRATWYTNKERERKEQNH